MFFFFFVPGPPACPAQPGLSPPAPAPRGLAPRLCCGPARPPGTEDPPYILKLPINRNADVMLFIKYLVIVITNGFDLILIK